MKISFVKILAFAMTAMIPAIESCDHKELTEFDQSELYDLHIEFDWGAESVPNSGGMTVCFFPIGHGSRFWRFDMAGFKSGDVALPAGVYSMAAFNNNLPSVEISDFTSLDALTASLHRNAEGETQGSGKLYCAVTKRIEVTPCGVIYHSPDKQCKHCPYGVVRSRVEPRYCRYTVIAENIIGSEYIRRARVLLSGMSSYIRLAGDIPGQDNLSLSVSLNPDGSPARIKGEATSLGIADNCTSFAATLVIERTDGVVLEKKFDISDAIMNAPNPRDVIIKIIGVDVPPPGHPVTPSGPDVGVGVNVGDWTIIQINLTT